MNNAAPSASKKPRINRWLVGLIATAFVPLSTVALVLLGYGYTLAVQSVFGISAELVANTAPEYLQLSSHVLVQLLSGTMKAFQGWDTVHRFYRDFQPVLWSGVTIWFVYFVVWRLRACWLKARAAMASCVVKTADAYRRNEPRWLAVCRGSLTQLLAWPIAVVVGVSRMVGGLPGAFWWALVSLGGILGLPAVMMFITVLGLLLICVVYGWLPAMGLGIGKSALEEWVVKPEVCVAVQSREQLMAPRLRDAATVVGAQCVCIEKDQKKPICGRLVAGSTRAVILFNPTSGAVQRVLVEDATVHVASSID